MGADRTAGASERDAAAGGKPTIAYLTTAYPNVSHTFIRREILGLESLGYRIFRVAIRCGEAVVDPLDVTEQERTLHLLEQPRVTLLRQIFGGLLLANWRLFRALAVAWQLHRRSERGLLRHVAYVIEALALLSCLHRHRVSHVHVHFGTNAAAVAMLARLMGGPTFSMTVHGPDEFDAPIGLSLGRKMREAAFTVAISSYCASQLKRWVEYAFWDRIHVVHCTLDEVWFEQARPVDEEADSLVSVGRLSAQKGQRLLVDAYADAVEAGLRSRLVLIGDGELRDVIEQRIGERGIETRVELTGWLNSDGVRQRLLAARALVLPSFAEGLPVVLMEAMALMRPVLSTSITGVPELVKDGEHGWLVVAGDQAALRDALLAADGATTGDLRRMGEQAQRRVRERHSQRTEVGKLDALFRRYIAR